jgi:hypothetical protein
MSLAVTGDGFASDLMFEAFVKICPENSNVVKIEQISATLHGGDISVFYVFF